MLIPKTIAAACGLLALACCTTPDQPGAESYTFGEAVQRNMAVQIINPEGSRVAEIPTLDGDRVMRAKDRLMRDDKNDSKLRSPDFVVPDNKTGSH